MVRGQLWAIVLMAKEEELETGRKVLLHAYNQEDALSRLSELEPMTVFTGTVARADALLISVGGKLRYFSPFQSDNGFVLACMAEEQ